MDGCILDTLTNQYSHCNRNLIPPAYADWVAFDSCNSSALRCSLFSEVASPLLLHPYVRFRAASISHSCCCYCLLDLLLFAFSRRDQDYATFYCVQKQQPSPMSNRRARDLLCTDVPMQCRSSPPETDIKGTVEQTKQKKHGVYVFLCSLAPRLSPGKAGYV